MGLDQVGPNPVTMTRSGPVELASACCACRAPPAVHCPRVSTGNSSMLLVTLLSLAVLATGRSLSVADRANAFVGYSERGDGQPLTDSTRLRGTPTVGDPSCRDDDKGCPSWQAAGQCTANPGFMLARCRLSCDQCMAIIPASVFAGRNVQFETEHGVVRSLLRERALPVW